MSRLRHSVFFRISTNFTSTLGIPLTSTGLKSCPVLKGNSGVELQAFTADLTKPPTCALRPVIPNNASTLRITAAAGTELAGAYSPGTVTFTSSRLKELYNPKAFITHAALLDQAFAHCPIFPTAASRRSLGRVSVPVWLIILSDQLPDRRLGEPLPHQLANPTRAHPQAINLSRRL